MVVVGGHMFSSENTALIDVIFQGEGIQHLKPLHISMAQQTLYTWLGGQGSGCHGQHITLAISGRSYVKLNSDWLKKSSGASFMKYLRFKLKILWYGVKINFSLKKELKPKFLLSCFVKLAPGLYHLYENLWKFVGFLHRQRSLIHHICLVDLSILIIWKSTFPI